MRKIFYRGFFCEAPRNLRTKYLQYLIVDQKAKIYIRFFCSKQFSDQEHLSKHYPQS